MDIFHRDLKPQHLMVTRDGYVKILDFGLAKLLTPSPESDSQAATLTKEGTSPGLVMGTAAYMSPEQALGKKLDARSDIFSLGAVLYEMATATRPFQGDTLAALFNEILNKTPSVPPDLDPSGRSPPRLAPGPRSSRGLSAGLPRAHTVALRSGVTRFLPAGGPEGPHL